MARLRRHPRLLIVAGLLLLICGAGVLSLATRLTPYARNRVIAVLSHRLDSEVELGTFQVSIFPRIEIYGEGLVIRHRGRRDVPPLISIRSFSAGAGVLGLLRQRFHLRSVTLNGLDVRLPADKPPVSPKADSDESSDLGEDIVIDRVVSSDARLEVQTAEPGKLPRVFAIHELVMEGFGFDNAVGFDALLTNPKPTGQIHAQGSFGPWHRRKPRATPVSGTYTFRDANLDTIRGIGGMLSSNGSFNGALERIAVSGVTSTPDFMVDIAGQAVPLTTRFSATVDGTNGDTWLNNVTATVLQSTIVAKGAIVRTEDVKGRNVSLSVVVGSGRIEDLLKLAVKSPRAPVTGSVSCTASFVLPAGERDTIEKLRLDARFALEHARFAAFNVQKRIEELSRRGLGEPQSANDGSVVSDLRGEVNVRNGVASFPQITFRVPGALVQLAGSYTLAGESLDFTGDLLLDASLSDTTTGLKAAVAKLAQPLFHRRGGGSRIPIKITGTREKPSFGVDVKKALLGRRQK